MLYPFPVACLVDSLDPRPKERRNPASTQNSRETRRRNSPIPDGSQDNGRVLGKDGGGEPDG